MIKANQALKEHKKLKSCWSEESQLTQKVVISILSELEQIHSLLYQATKDIKRIRIMNDQEIVDEGTSEDMEKFVKEEILS